MYPWLNTKQMIRRTWEIKNAETLFSPVLFLQTTSHLLMPCLPEHRNSMKPASFFLLDLILFSQLEWLGECVKLRGGVAVITMEASPQCSESLHFSLSVTLSPVLHIPPLVFLRPSIVRTPWLSQLWVLQCSWVIIQIYSLFNLLLKPSSRVLNRNWQNTFGILIYNTLNN